MGTPSPFEVSRTISNNLGQAYRSAQDSNAIDKILSEANASGNPQVLQDSIGKILSQVSPERQPQAIQYLQNRYQAVQEQEKRKRQEISAQRGGYGVDDPVGVQTQQVKDRNKQQRLNDFGIGNNTTSTPQLSNQSLDQSHSGENPQQPTPPQSIFKRLTNDQLLVATGSPDKEISEPAKQELQIRNEDRKHQFEVDKGKRDINNRLGEKVLEQTDKIAEAIPQKQTALNLMNQAIIDKNLDFWSWDNIAEATGIEGLRSPEGALFKTASKEYLLGNIARAGARPNQWIEQQISEMLTKIGRSTAANLSVTRALENELDLEKARISITNEVKQELDSRGEDYGNIGRMVESRLSKYAEQKQNELFNDLRAIKSIDEKKAQNFHKVDAGTKISPIMVEALLARFNNDPDKAAEEAKKLGYSIDE